MIWRRSFNLIISCFSNQAAMTSTYFTIRIYLSLWNQSYSSSVYYNNFRFWTECWVFPCEFINLIQSSKVWNKRIYCLPYLSLSYQHLFFESHWLWLYLFLDRILKIAAFVIVSQYLYERRSGDPLVFLAYHLEERMPCLKY